MPRGQDRAHLPRQPGRVVRHPPDPASRADDEAAMAELQRLVGNAGMAELLDPSTARALESELGGGRPLREVVRGESVGTRADGDARSVGAEAGVDVRVHDDARSKELGGRLGAAAFTFGRDIFLGPDAPPLDSAPGERLLRHELTHVRQQEDAGTGAPRRVSSPTSPQEQEAARAAVAAPGPAASGTGQTVHRQVDESEEAEEEVQTLRADTVQRQVLTEDEEEVLEPPAAAEPEPAGGPASDQAPTPAESVAEPANPALAALFDATVVAKHQAALDALQGSSPAPIVAFEALGEALGFLRPLSEAYRGRDELLFAMIGRYGNALNTAREMLAPYVDGQARPVEWIRDFLAHPRDTSSIRDRLH